MSREQVEEKERIKNLGAKRIGAAVEALGQPSYRAKQLCEWLYPKLAPSFEAMSNLPAGMREHLSEKYSVDSLGVKDILSGSDGTKKFIFRLRDGVNIESVLMPDRDRLTLCISTQAGCAMGCRFCLTAGLGFRRNLDTAEIVDQYITARRHIGADKKISHIVVMGMGEPLANYNNFKLAVETFTSPWGFAMSPRRITFSTVGLPGSIARAAEEFPPIGLAVSLNAPDDALRGTIMPAARKHKMDSIISTAKEYSAKTGGELTFEYVLLAGTNSSPLHARKLAALLRGIDCKVNVIPFNSYDHSHFVRPEEVEVDAFMKELKKGGVLAFVRYSRGRDIGAACGQLGGAVDNRPVKPRRAKTAPAGRKPRETKTASKGEKTWPKK